GTIVKTDIKPRMVTLLQLPDAVQGALYEKLLFATGNGDIRFTYDSMKVAGAGFQLTADGRLSGVPAKAGHFQFPVIARDEDGDTVSTIFQLTVSKKLADEIVV